MQQRSGIHRWHKARDRGSIVARLLAAASSCAIALAFLSSGHTARAQDDDFFSRAPRGWAVVRREEVPRENLDGYIERLGQRPRSVTSASVTRSGPAVMIYIYRAETPEKAAEMHARLVREGGARAAVHLRGDQVIELMAANMFSIREAEYAFNLRTRTVGYIVRFQAAPLRASNDSQWESLFQACADADQMADRVQAEARVRRLMTGFMFDTTLRLRRFGQGGTENTYEVLAGSQTLSGRQQGDFVEFDCDSPDTKFGIPYVTVTASISSSIVQSRADVDELADPDQYLAATRFWPVDDPAVRRVGLAVTEEVPDAWESAGYILEWFSNSPVFRDSPTNTMTRHGVTTFLDQRYGSSWDYSDAFVTLCRVNGIPARQIAGWRYGRQYRFWAEIWIDGRGWVAVDPMTGGTCGSDYVGWILSNDGQIPLVYLSDIKVEIEAQPDDESAKGSGG